jgi:hypothetical protein
MCHGSGSQSPAYNRGGLVQFHFIRMEFVMAGLAVGEGVLREFTFSPVIIRSFVTVHSFITDAV